MVSRASCARAGCLGRQARWSSSVRCCSVRRSQLVAGQVAEELIAWRAETGHVVVTRRGVERQVAGCALVVRVAELLLTLVVDDPGGVEEPLRVIDRVDEVRSGLI